MEATNGTSTTGNNTQQSNFYNKTVQDKSASPLSTFKKILYFSHFVLIAIYTTYVLVQYPHARQLSFSLVTMILYGYMAIWTILINFLLLTCKKENYAVMFDRLVIKLFIMVWPIFGAISYAEDQFMHIVSVAIFALYMTIVSLLLVMYELYVCVFAEHENPEYIFEHNDLQECEDVIWGQRKTYNQNIIDGKNIKYEAPIHT